MWMEKPRLVIKRDDLLEPRIWDLRAVLSFTHCVRMSDPSSSANLASFAVSHLSLRLSADFTTTILSGTATLTIKNLTNLDSTLILDSKLLSISAIIGNVDGLTLDLPLVFTFGKFTETFGAALIIELPAELIASKEFRITIHYSTSKDASAIQWLPKEQTCGKKYPYLFTQCQAIHCRSFVPIQDSPLHKFTYDADITVPAPLVALMSALRENEGVPILSADGSLATYSFRQPVPLSSYLLSLAIGKLESKRIGPRSHIWTEKEMLESAAFEFEETENFLTAAEQICGPYNWGIYDLLCLPTSFPYGGMENPCLTFVTPTVICGDRSLVGVVAHEIAHSWMGNLVTNHNWTSFWCNEGFCVFVERKIYQILYGRPYSHLQAAIGQKNLKDTIKLFGENHNYTCLCPHLEGVDPDDAFSSVPYEKGFNLLFQLQDIVGEDAMNDYLKVHCLHYGYKTIDCKEWAVYFTNYFAERGIKIDYDWNAVFHTPGMPNSLNLDLTLVNEAHFLGDKWIADSTQIFGNDDLKNWKSSQVVLFLEKVDGLQQQLFSNAKNDQELIATKERFRELLTKMDRVYNLNSVKNAEIRFLWQILAIRAELEYVYPEVVDFVVSQGRMKFTRPLYRELNKVPSGQALAQATFQKFRHMYHSICAKMVARDLGYNCLA